MGLHDDDDDDQLSRRFLAITVTFHTLAEKRDIYDLAKSLNFSPSFYLLSVLLKHFRITNRHPQRPYDDRSTRDSISRNIIFRIPSQELIEKVKSVSKNKRTAASAFCRSLMLKDLEKRRPPEDEKPQPDNVPKLSGKQEQILYRIEKSSFTIITSKNADLGWEGLLSDGKKTSHWVLPFGKEEVWPHLCPDWADSKATRSLLFIATRIDIDGVAYFTVPNTPVKTYASAKWDGSRFTDGEVIEAAGERRRQVWESDGRYSMMPLGPFSLLPNVRHALALLSWATVVKK